MESNIPTPISTPPSQRPRDSYQSAPVSGQGAPLIIRTMKSDAALAIQTQNETLVSMSLAEEKKKALQRTEAATTAPLKPTPKPRGRVVIILGLILFVTGSGIAIKFALPTIRKISLPNLPNVSLPTFGTPSAGQPTKVTSKTAVPTISSLIPAQSEKRFTINKETPENLFTMIATERAAGVTTGNIRNLYFEEEAVTLEGEIGVASISAHRLLILANIPTPAIFARSLETPFMAGLYGEEGAQATPFFVFKVSGYDTGLAGMLAWESDLPYFFDTVFGTKFITAPSGPIKFRDKVVSGYDTRSIEGLPAGSIFYAFADQSTVIITSSQSALEALVSRLSVR
ncbi:MAG TPA: hypothetical protein DCS20_01300 [Candidatus Yonathbacteria bacterium]|nr:hypothetical protein [Candidatus Yonathbacteria bacterium]